MARNKVRRFVHDQFKSVFNGSGALTNIPVAGKKNVALLFDRGKHVLGIVLEDPSGIAADLMVRLSQAGRVAHQAAGGSKFAHLIDRGHSARRIWLKDLNTRFSERTTG